MTRYLVSYVYVVEGQVSVEAASEDDAADKWRSMQRDDETPCEPWVIDVVEDK
jgi:hypothetical protein